FRQIIQPHEHNFSVPSFGRDFRLNNKVIEKTTNQHQLPPDTTSELTETLKIGVATVNQAQPLNFVTTKMGPAIDQTADFTYTSRPQLREMQANSSPRRQNQNERQLPSTKDPIFMTSLPKPLLSRPGSMYLPKSKNDINFTQQNTNPEQAKMAQLSQVNILHNSTGYTVGTKGQFDHSSLHRASSLGRNPHNSVPSFNSTPPYSGLPGIFENATSQVQIQSDLNHSQEINNQTGYQRCHHQQQFQRLQPPHSHEAIKQLPQLTQSVLLEERVFPQNTGVSSQACSLAAVNHMSYHNSSSSNNPINNASERLLTIPVSNTNIENASNPVSVIPQNYMLASGITSFPYTQTVNDFPNQSVQKSQLLPGTTILQPQIAIVTVDPETLKAILSGSFNTQTLFQSINMNTHSNPNIHMTPFNLSTQTPSNSNLDPDPLSVTKTNLKTSEAHDVSSSDLRITTDMNRDCKSMDTSGFLNDTQQKSSPQFIINSENKSSNGEQLIRHSNGVQPTHDSSSGKPQASALRLRNPPRTLRFLDKSESFEAGNQSEDVQRSALTGGREPGKLKPSSFVFRSRKAETDEPPGLYKNKVTGDSEQAKSNNADLPGRHKETSSISAYYEQLKRRNSRPLSAYRVTADQQLQSSADSSLLRTSEASANFEISSVNRRSAHQLTRGHTVASSRPDCSGTSSSVPKERTMLKQADPSIMSVAERARQWLLAQSSGCQDTKRYSTSGFIDQDLVDCQDLVPVEDRVKMFDTGASSGRQTEKKPEVKSELQEIRERNQVKLNETNPTKADLSSNPTNKSVTSVTLQTSKSNSRRLHSSVNLQRIKQEPAQTGVVQPTSKTLQNVHFANSSSKIAPVKGVQQSNGDELTRSNLNEEQSLFNQRLQQGQQNLINKSLNVSTESKRIIRRKTQPITLDDLARANQLILERYYGKHLESPFGSVKGDEQDSFGFHEYDSQISTPEASLISKLAIQVMNNNNNNNNERFTGT
ncbi:hypothetical protein MN116_003030, partial [Schistosoma mekongi]